MGDLAFVTVVGRFVPATITQSVGEVLLDDRGMIVRILVAGSVPERGGTLVMRVA